MRLIDAEVLKNKVIEQISSLKTRLLLDKDFITETKIVWFIKLLKIIENVPTIEAKPVVHAYWEEVREGRHICSNCKVKASLTSDEYDYMEDLSDYCPRCGAQMDEEVSE